MGMPPGPGATSPFPQAAALLIKNAALAGWGNAG